MRDIKYIVIHCTATKSTATVESIQSYWRTKLGWKSPGYHYIIDTNGVIKQLLNEELVANGVVGYNDVSIHVSYIGGIDANNNPKDTRTLKQLSAMKVWIKYLSNRYPTAIIQGHRDFPNVHKACPSFDVKSWLEEIEIWQ
ncbi:N-acetylmuramoyl-L-alanine amidase [Chitinophaga sp. CF118]|uniref:N-acetylmuramoyl-L-alanine amidase n=1 Tax=Chitinophaga sp. CF118 TaxID=1884367 RepID=UPI0008ECB03E|nr:N-acetylmuramoyl-L-alanine amidase [Chitinophaga sp. CF118]SFD83562.1 N-acetylmuramoyl-L-alanine amidase [Chitinophaga sp. CF118]